MADLDLSKHTENGPVLDFSKLTCNSKEELRKLMDKVPDYKIRPVKVKTEELKIRDKDYKFKTGKKDFKQLKESYAFANPIPVEMRSLNIADLVAVPIDWRMLTTLRPKVKLDEDYFSRLVELGKSELDTKRQDRRVSADSFIRKSKNKAGVIETRIVSCSECGEEFCDGKTCNLLQYDCFARISEEQKNATILDPSQSSEKTKKKKIKRRSRSKSKGKGRRNKSKSKSKSPSKSTTRKNDKK